MEIDGKWIHGDRPEDVEKYVAELQKCVSEGVNLSINANYPTGFTIELMLQKAFSEAKSLCIKMEGRKGKCVVCGKESNLAYFGKSY